MELNENIEQETLEYLHLEYGESPEDEEALKISELKYEDEYILDGLPTHYWSYPTKESCWAIATPFCDTFALGMTGTSPKQLKHA